MTGTNVRAATDGDHSWPRALARGEREAERKDLLDDEKAHTHALDRINARRRRLPMTEARNDHTFADPAGKHRFTDLFEGCTQLVPVTTC